MQNIDGAINVLKDAHHAVRAEILLCHYTECTAPTRTYDIEKTSCYTAPVPSLRIIFASTSGHTEFVIDTLIERILECAKDIAVHKQRSEEAAGEDLTKDDVLLLASGTWNTGSVEGQLNPHMHELLLKKTTNVDLKKTPCAVIALGDDRYFYTARANEHLSRFIIDHGGRQLLPALTIINEPYGQEDRIRHFADELVKKIHAAHSSASVE